MEVNKIDVLNALSIVKPGLANREHLEQTTSFAFVHERVITYNDEISISHPIDDFDVTGAVNAEELYGLLGKLKEEVIKIKVKDGQLLVKSGNVKAGLKCDHEIVLPLEQELSEKKKWHDLEEPKAFNKALTFAMHTCGSDMSQVKLTCVCVQKKGIVYGSDGYRIAKCLIPKMPVKDFLIAASIVSEVTKLKPIRIALHKDWVHFQNKKGTIISCRLVLEEYMENEKLDGVLAIKNKDAIVFPDKIKAMLEKVGQFAKRDFVFDEVVEVDIKKGLLTLRAEAQITHSWVTESAKIDFDGEINFSITPLLFVNILQETKTAQLGKRLDKVKFLAEDGSWEYVIMLRGK
jgi:DNA polymerase III sliding clamp (beta) subunit (PCNA family)